MAPTAELVELPGVERGVPLAPYTTWHVGGPAELLWAPTAERLGEVLRRCHESSIPVWYLGRGSNVLIHDAGLPGLTICTRNALKRLTLDDGLIVAECGVPLPTLSKFAAAQGFGGYEFLIGIPGTVGGGVVINAGLKQRQQHEISEILVDVDLLLPDGTLQRRSAAEIELGYRTSSLLDQSAFLLRARFQPKRRASQAAIRRATAEHLAERRRKQPLSKPTAGSTFKSPAGGKAAGWYIEQAGLKGHRVGRVEVSVKHANFLVNVGGATAAEIERLMAVVQERVYQRFGVWLEPEIRKLGSPPSERTSDDGRSDGRR